MRLTVRKMPERNFYRLNEQMRLTTTSSLWRCRGAGEGPKIRGSCHPSRMAPCRMPSMPCGVSCIILVTNTLAMFSHLVWHSWPQLELLTCRTLVQALSSWCALPSAIPLHAFAPFILQHCSPILHCQLGRVWAGRHLRARILQSQGP